MYLSRIYLPSELDIERTRLLVSTTLGPANVLSLLVLEVFFRLNKSLVRLKTTKKGNVLYTKVKHLKVTGI